MELFILWIACGIGAAWLAHSKGYDGCSWAVLGLIGGFITLLVAVGMPSRKRGPSDPPSSTEGPGV